MLCVWCHYLAQHKISLLKNLTLQSDSFLCQLCDGITHLMSCKENKLSKASVSSTHPPHSVPVQISGDLAAARKHSSLLVCKSCTGVESVWSQHCVQWWCTNIRGHSWSLIYTVWTVEPCLAPGSRESLAESHLHTRVYAWFPPRCAYSLINLWIQGQWQETPGWERGKKAVLSSLN